MNELLLLPLFVVGMWLAFFLPGGLLAGLCLLLGRRRVQWFKWEYALLVVPYLVWLLTFFGICAIGGGDGKHINNALGEPLLLGFGVALACIMRVLEGNRFNQKATATALFSVACLLAVVIACFVPNMDGDREHNRLAGD